MVSWQRIVWLTVVIAWFTTVLIGRINRDEIGDLIGLVIGILVSIIIGAVIPAVFGSSLGALSSVCISFTGGIAYTVALFTINDRNVHGAGIGAFVSAVLGGLILLFVPGKFIGGILVFLTVIGAMAVAQGVESGLEENTKRNRTSRRSVFTLLAFFVSLVVLFGVYIDESFFSIFMPN